MWEKVKRNAKWLWTAVATALIALAMLVRSSVLRARRDAYADDIGDLDTAKGLAGTADAIRPRREALEAAAREIAARKPDRNIEAMSADEIAREYWRMRSGEKPN